jgi:hypothetical protein
MKKAMGVLAALLVVAGLAVAVQSPAAAAPAVSYQASTVDEITGGTPPGQAGSGGVSTQSLSQCNALAVEMCRWIDANYSGTFGTFIGNRYQCYILSATWDRKITSVWNYRPLEDLRLWSGNACGGDLLIVNPNTGSPNLGLVGSGWNDKARSFMIVWD